MPWQGEAKSPSAQQRITENPGINKYFMISYLPEPCTVKSELPSLL